MREWRGDAGQPTPQEIVARLHKQIAAKSPEHAALVAGFEAMRAETVMPDPAPGYEWYRELAADDAT